MSGVPANVEPGDTSAPTLPPSEPQMTSLPAAPVPEPLPSAPLEDPLPMLSDAISTTVAAEAEGMLRDPLANLARPGQPQQAEDEESQLGSSAPIAFLGMPNSPKAHDEMAETFLEDTSDPKIMQALAQRTEPLHEEEVEDENMEVDGVPAPLQAASDTHPNQAYASSSRTIPSEPSVSFESPYAPPSNAIYPPHAIANPHFNDREPQPVFANIPANSLYRPAFLPSDLDERIAKSSIWIGVHQTTSEVAYFVPQPCERCSSLRKHCDRSQPTCESCRARGCECVPGREWSVLKTGKGKVEGGQHLTKTMDEGDGGGRRLSAADKGKGRASPVEDGPTVAQSEFRASPSSTTTKGKQRASSPADPLQSTNGDKLALPPSSPSRPVRNRKKRRLSDAADLSDLDLPFPSTAIPSPSRPAPAKKARRPAAAKFSLVEDDAYLARIAANAKRPPLTRMKGPCPVWGNTRQAIMSSCEYLGGGGGGGKVESGSVSVGVGGVARGVVLEGEAGDVFWGKGEEAGTIIVPMGKPRPRSPRIPAGSPPTERDPSQQDDRVATSDNAFIHPHDPINVLPSIQDVTDIPRDSVVGNGNSRKHAATSVATDVGESPEIEALLLAQRARTPLALALTQDYSGAPFKVPRPFVVLGWFWVTEAWVEPVAGAGPTASAELVQWRFRFDWCAGEQGTPWWCSAAEPDRLSTPLSTSQEKNDQQWVMAGPGVTGSTTVRDPREEEVVDDKYEYRCSACGKVSGKVYNGEAACLNERCTEFGESSAPTATKSSFAKHPAPLQPLTRILPEQIGLRLRPPEPSGKSFDALAGQQGRDWWRGWVCKKCGMANERRKWEVWECEACKHAINVTRKTIDVDALVPPTRPIATGPRADAGFPSFPGVAPQPTRSWQLYKDDIKVITHHLSQGFGEGCEVHHALNCENAQHRPHWPGRKVLRMLQGSGGGEVPMRRHTVTGPATRPAEKALSPFYTYLCGPSPAPVIEGLPAGQSVAWSKAPMICLDGADLINERAGRMFHGQPERFNSVLFVAWPPQLPGKQQPHLTIPPNSYLGLLFLGSDGGVKFRGTSKAGEKARQGELTTQQGDVIGFKTGAQPLEVIPRLDGFGFVCVARQIYRSDSASPVATPHGDRDTSYEPPKPTGKVPKPKAARDSANNSNRPPPKPTKFVPAPLTGWYIGTRPLDRDEPLRLMPAEGRDDVKAVPGVEGVAKGKEKESAPAVEVEGGESTAAEVEKEYTGEIILDVIPPPPTLFEPPPLSPVTKKRKLPTTAEEKTSSITPKRKAPAQAQAGDTDSVASGGGKGKGKKARASVAGSEVAEKAGGGDKGKKAGGGGRRKSKVDHADVLTMEAGVGGSEVASTEVV